MGALVLTSALVPRPARASCTPPAPTVVWSYPRDGETGVPTNVTLWLLLSNWHRPGKALLDGKEVPVNGFGFGYRPLEPLAPSGPHELVIDGAPPGEPPVTLTIRFTTASGDTELEPAMVPAVTAASATQSRPVSNLCQAVVHAMDCFDTGQDTHLVFETEARPLVFVVERVPMLMGESPVFTLWPGECELPEIFVNGSVARTCTYRYRLHALEATGLRAMSPPFCPSELIKAAPGDDGGAPPEPDAAPPPSDAGAPTGGGPSTANPRIGETGGAGGCSVGGGAGSGALLLLALALLLRRRR